MKRRPIIAKRWSLLLAMVFGFTVLYFNIPTPEYMAARMLPSNIRVGKATAIEAKARAFVGRESQEANAAASKNTTTSTQPHYQPGVAKSIDVPYTKTIVMAKLKKDSTRWLDEEIGQNEYTRFAIYTADDLTVQLHPPRNKGHEAMSYLSYIIEYYEDLSDVNIFIHADRTSWHNNKILLGDMVQMIKRLSAERVQREGYMNLRCEWTPGCPNWMHPGNADEDPFKPEETLLAPSWTEIFPGVPIPKVLSQPCCAQFAVSRDRIRAQPVERYKFYRNWLLETKLSDVLSGRVWEYIWHYVFTGEHVYCPKEHICNCDGFGMCFGGEEQYNEFMNRWTEVEMIQDEINKWEADREEIHTLKDAEDQRWEITDAPEEGKDAVLRNRMGELNRWCNHKLDEANERGRYPMNRAVDAGRLWKEGDGF